MPSSRLQHRLLAAAAGLAAAAAALPGTSPVMAAGPGANLAVVGVNPLANRGMNAALAVAEHCAYVGSRDDAAPQVLDITDPAHPVVAGTLPAHSGSTPRELRAVPQLREVIVMYYRLSGGGLNDVEVYRWDSDCSRPSLVGSYSFDGAPHEFYLWQDPARASRVLLYVGMFAGSSRELQVVDVSDPTQPRLAGTWTVPSAYGHAPLHSISLSPDGRMAFVSLWTGGLVVADTSDYALGKPEPAFRPLTPAGAAYRTPPGNVHSAVPLPGRPLVLTTDERYPATYGPGCPFGPAHIVDVSDPARPRAVGTMAVPENTPATCAAAAHGTWTSHNATVTNHLAFITWYSAGLQTFQLDDPAQPVQVTAFRPGAASPAQRDLLLGTTDAVTWSYPVLYRGLIYVVDINQGLFVLRYTGPHQEEVAAGGLLEGNSNVHAAAVPSSATATPSLPPTPLPGITAAPASRGLGIPGGTLRVVVPIVVALISAAMVAVVYLRSRRPRNP
jgi:hypothetical protein